MAAFDSSNGKCLEDCLIVKAVDGLAVGLVLMNPAGKVMWMNRASEDLLSVMAEECLGKPVEHLLRDPQLAAFWHDAATNEGSHLAEVSVRWPEERELKMKAVRCHDRDGAEIGRALLIVDVTEEHKIRVEMTQAVADRLLRLTAGHMPPEPVSNLTHQELRILRLVGRGLGNDEIADESGITSSTVRTHLKSLYRKLSLNSRTEAVSFAVRNHLV